MAGSVKTAYGEEEIIREKRRSTRTGWTKCEEKKSSRTINVCVQFVRYTCGIDNHTRFIIYVGTCAFPTSNSTTYQYIVRKNCSLYIQYNVLVV